MTIKRIISLIMCLVMLFAAVFSPQFLKAYALGKTYIKEIVTSTAETDAEAKKWLTDRGYTVVGSNLNAGTDEDPVYLGYKTTMNKSEAITDISLMDMNNGYEWMDYEQFAVQNQENINEMTQKLALSCVELKEKLDAGSRSASIALDYLNIFTVPETRQKLGDYLIDKSRTKNDYRRILLVCNSLVINIIYSQLAFGISEMKGNTWIERLSKSGPDETYRGEDFTDYWNDEYNTYSKSALELLDTLKTFAKLYKEADERRKNNGGEIVISSEQSEDEAKKTLDDFLKSGEMDDESGSDALIIATYEYLNEFGYSSDLPTSATEIINISVKPEYSETIMFDGTNAFRIIHTSGYGDDEYEPIPFEVFIQNYASYSVMEGTRLFPTNTSLGDVILELAEINPDDEEQLSLLYPLVRALTPSQRYLMSIQGLDVFTSLSVSDDETYNEIESKREGYATDLYEALGTNEASVWIGTNRDIFESKIGLTTKAKRAADASNDYDKLTDVSEFDVNIKTALCFIGAACTATAGITFIALGIGAFVFHGVGATIVCGMMILGHAISATVCGVAFGCIGFIGIIASFLAIAALIVCAIVYAVDYFIDLYNYYNPDYSAIPSVMIDSDENNYITYKAVRGNDGKPADINVWEGRRWNALYVTTDTKAGSPLTINESGIAFKVVYGSTATPSLSKPVTHFGSVKAVNLNDNTYDDDVNGIYLYFYPEDYNSESDNPDDEPTGDVLYLESLVLYTHEDGRVVKDRIVNDSGYQLIDFNLTPNTDYDTYIGYTTTTNPANAITDIRVSYAGSSEKYYFGTVTDTYGMAGTTSKTIGNEESTGLLVSLYYTKSKSRGTPILADLLISGKRPDKSLDYEPVNLFSGGDAFDFNSFAEEDCDTWGKHAYIYFMPSIVYNEQNSKAYLGGISFISGSTDMDEGKLEDYVKELGLTASNIDLTRGFFNDEDRTWLCYSVTYNPYRAIYDIGVYTAEFKSSFLPENLVLDGSGYVACQTFTQGDIRYYGNVLWGGHYRLIRPNHAYINKIEDYGGSDEYGDSYVCNRGMYVSGPISGKEPIEMDSFIISKSSTIPDGCVAVHDMTDKYATKALNLAMCDNDNKNYMYIFYKGNAPVKEKYISSISVFFSKEEDCSYDSVMYRLMAAGGDEIIRVNLAGEESDSWTYTDGAVCFDDDSDRDDYEDAHAYIRVTRTKTKNSGIGTICLVESGGGPVSLTLPINHNGNNALFTRAGDKIVYDEDKSYYIYYATVGNKISDLKIDKTAVVHDWITALNEKMNLVTNKGWYIHSYSDISLPYYSLVMFHRSNDKLNSISKLLAAGCTDVERINVNGDPVYIGWAKTSSTAKSIKNIVISDSETSFGDNSTYKCGGSAHGVYIFYTTEGDKSKSIIHFKVGTTTPTEFGDGLKWEYIQNNEGKIANLNTVVDNSDSKKTYRLYVNHKNNEPYSENSFMAASTLTGDYNALFIALLCLIPAVVIIVIIAVRHKARGKKSEKEAQT